jgi:hypothetical protein
MRLLHYLKEASMLRETVFALSIALFLGVVAYVGASYQPSSAVMASIDE